MNRSDAERAQRLMDAYHAGELNDLSVYALLASVRAEAVAGERAREVLRLELLAREHLSRGDEDAALALAGAAEGLILRGPTPADVADA